MVLVYSDDKQLMTEMLGKAAEIAVERKGKVTAVHIGKKDDQYTKSLIAYGADNVIQVENSLETFKPEEYTDILTQISEETKPSVIFIGSNKNGKELAPRLAAKLEVGCITDCTNLSLQNGNVIAERVVYSGNAISVEKLTHTTGIITIPSKVFEPKTKDDKRTGDVQTKQITPNTYGSKIVNVKQMQTGGVNVEDAEIIVSCGRGLKNKDDIKLVEELAQALKGHTVGCSRPIAADLKWLSEDHWIGLSGHKVKPKLYVAVGISGQIQHIAGMRDSSVIVAINKDPDALIFKSADYGIVGDLYQVLPKLITAIKEKIG